MGFFLIPQCYMEQEDRTLYPQNSHRYVHCGWGSVGVRMRTYVRAADVRTVDVLFKWRTGSSNANREAAWLKDRTSDQNVSLALEIHSLMYRYEQEKKNLLLLFWLVGGYWVWSGLFLHSSHAHSERAFERGGFCRRLVFVRCEVGVGTALA